MDLRVSWAQGAWSAHFGAERWPCAVGRSGACLVKQEGDGMTPVGRWQFRAVHYRADRLKAPATPLPCRAMEESDGWCDDVLASAYNQRVTLPFDGRHERLWRDDHLYDIVVVLGHNDDPPAPGLGSAIFLHLARLDFGPTEGCVALEREALLRILRDVGPQDAVLVETEGPPALAV